MYRNQSRHRERARLCFSYMTIVCLAEYVLIASKVGTKPFENELPRLVRGLPPNFLKPFSLKASSTESGQFYVVK